MGSTQSMLRIQRSANADIVVFTLSGRIRVEDLAELQRVFAFEGRETLRRTGFERGQARGSRCSEVSGTLRSEGDHASELPGLYPRVDEERDRSYSMITGSGRTACSA